jgi:linoleoyl-CoA desaturase
MPTEKAFHCDPRSPREWTTERYEAFGVELDSVHADARARLGPEDVAYVKKVRALSRLSEVAGRALIHFSLDPATWFAGVLALWGHHQLETIEIGHSALHGAWDGLEDAKEFHSSHFRWDTPVDEEAWKKEHNVLHHQYTNIVGRDPDLNYGPLRVTEATTWMPYHFIQVSQFLLDGTGVPVDDRAPRDRAHRPGSPLEGRHLRSGADRQISPSDSQRVQRDGQEGRAVLSS